VPDLSLAARHVSKRFGAVQALDDVSLEVAQGSIHSVVGENGAGKTTLMRIVYGLYAPDSGWIELAGRRVSFANPRDAIAAGVSMVHQHSLLLESMTVAENVMLALPGLGIPPRSDVIARLRQLAEESNLHLDPEARVRNLAVAGRQRAEMLTALFYGARVLILDEPTTVLTPQEVDGLFRALRRLRDAGTTIVLVTHKLEEVLAISDTVTVLRRGRRVATVPARETDQRGLVRMMIGRDIAPAAARAEVAGGAARGEPALELDALSVNDQAGSRRVQDVHLKVFPGEILAITGVEGNGQAELAEAIVGVLGVTSGEVRLNGHRATGWSVRHRRRAGLAYIPENRMVQGIDASVNIRDNLVLGLHATAPYARFGLRLPAAVDSYARRLISTFGIVAPNTVAPASTLSGGNLQKIVVAREIAKRPAVLLAVQPTQGVDVSAAAFIRSTLASLRTEGMAILLVSSDLNEVSELADRAIVLFKGRVFGTLERRELSPEAIGLYAMGVAS